MTIKRHFKVPVVFDQKSALDLLDDAFAIDGLTISRQGIKQIMQKGCVWLETGKYTQRLRRAKKTMVKGQILHCYYNEDVLSTIPQPAKCVSDEGEYSIWNKPSGMLSQGSKWGDHCTVHRWAEKHLKPERPAFIVHRLDRAANGVIIIAHEKKVAAKFSLMFKNKEIEKHYVVKVVGDFSTLDGFDPNRTTIKHALEGKAAISHIYFIQYDLKKNESLLNVSIETGRKHQIRKHLSQAGYAVVGDRLYGVESKNMLNLQLSASSLSFICPIKKEEKKFMI